MQRKYGKFYADWRDEHGTRRRKACRTAAARAQIAAQAIAQLRSLLPAARRQVRAGKPALLRMILRASR